MDYEVEKDGVKVIVEETTKASNEVDRLKAYADKLGVKLQSEEKQYEANLLKRNRTLRSGSFFGGRK